MASQTNTVSFIIAIAIVFVVLPRLAGPVLVGVSLVILVFALYQHITLFKAEYAMSTWADQLKFYAPFVLIAALFVAVLIYFGVLASGNGGTSALPIPTLPNTPMLPSAETATNPLTAAINTGMRGVNNLTGQVTNAANQITVPNFGLRNNKNNNRSLFSPL